MINCRHGLMLVGPPYGAKTVCYRVLAKAITGVTREDPKFGELPVDVNIFDLIFVMYILLDLCDKSKEYNIVPALWQLRSNLLGLYRWHLGPNFQEMCL